MTNNNTERYVIKMDGINMYYTTTLEEAHIRIREMANKKIFLESNYNCCIEEDFDRNYLNVIGFYKNSIPAYDKVISRFTVRKIKKNEKIIVDGLRLEN